MRTCRAVSEKSGIRIGFGCKEKKSVQQSRAEMLMRERFPSRNLPCLLPPRAEVALCARGGEEGGGSGRRVKGDEREEGEKRACLEYAES